MSKSLKHLSFSTIRLLLSIPIPLIAAFSFNYFNHKSYYSTIRNIQTVDFNILTHTLPAKLSLALRDNDIEEIQRTINSNYGLFGIFVTDCQYAIEECPGQQVIAKSQPERAGWGDKRFPDVLSGSLFDILRNPPPTTAEWEFYSPGSNVPISSGRENSGKIIGRVYYVRRDSPNFIENHQEWLSMPVNAVQTLTETGDFKESIATLEGFASRGANKYFFLTNLLGILTGILFWRVWERFSYKRKIEKDSYLRKEREFDSRKKSYEQKLRALQGKVKSLKNGLSAQEQVAEKLYQELDSAKNRASQEKQRLQELNVFFERAQAVSSSAKEENQLLLQQLTGARQQTQEKWQLVASLQNQLDSTQKSNIFEQLQRQLKQAIQEASENQQNIGELTKRLNSSSQFLSEKEDEYQALAKQFSIAQENLSEKENDIRYLQRSLETVLTREDQYLERIEKLKDKTLSLEVDNQRLESSQKNEQIKHKITLNDFLKEREEFINDIASENECLREDKE